MNAVFSPGFFEGIVGGQALWQGGGRNVTDYYPFVINLAFVFIAAPLVTQERNLRARKKTKTKRMRKRKRRKKSGE